MDTLIEPLEEHAPPPWSYGAEELPAGLAALFGVRVEQRHCAFPDLVVVTYVRCGADALELARMATAFGWHCTIPRQAENSGGRR